MQTERESTRRLRTDAHLYDRPDRAHRDMVHFDAPSASRHVGARVLAWLCGSHVLCMLYSKSSVDSTAGSRASGSVFCTQHDVSLVCKDAWLVQLTCRTSCLAFSLLARVRRTRVRCASRDTLDPAGRGWTVERGAHVKLSATAGVAAPGPRLTSFACLLF